MADEKNTIAKLEERLTNAAATFKDMKAQLAAKDKENAELKAQIAGLSAGAEQGDVASLKARISELEDELTLNGGAKEEVDGLKARLEKAKEIFATQKAKIAEMTEINAEALSQIEELKANKEELEAAKAGLEGKVDALEEQIDALEERNSALNDRLAQIKVIVGE
jgi:chromosome segregation ATPase